MSSKIVSVKLFRQGATIVRRLALPLSEGRAPAEVEVQGLPLALDDDSIRVSIDEAGVKAGIEISHVRVGLHVRPPEVPLEPPSEARFRDLERTLHHKERLFESFGEEIGLLEALEVPPRPTGDSAAPPPASPMAARLAMESFSNTLIDARLEARHALRREISSLREALEAARVEANRAQALRQASEARLSKVVRVALQHEGAPASAALLSLEYHVQGARWAPRYECRIDEEGKAVLQMRAMVRQATGEDWRQAHISLSTASPLKWTELPELATLRIGRAQAPPPTRRGYRAPPGGGGSLFEDYDRVRRGLMASHPVAPPWSPPTLGSEEVDTGRSVNEKTPEQERREMTEKVDRGELKVPWVSLGDCVIEPEVAALIPRDLATRHEMVPIGRHGSALVLAMADPSNIYAIDEIKFITGYNIEVVTAGRGDIRRTIGQLYPADEGPLYDEVVMDFSMDEVMSMDEAPEPLTAGVEAPVVKLVNLILVDAIKKGVSEILLHGQEHFIVSYRTGGVLDEAMMPPNRLRAAVASRIKVMADLDPVARPQQGVIELRVGRGRVVFIHVDITQGAIGERISMRLRGQVGDVRRARFGLLVLGDPDNKGQRSRLQLIEQAEDFREVALGAGLEGDPMAILRAARARALAASEALLPDGTRDVGDDVGWFDFTYEAADPVDVPSDGEVHTIPVCGWEAPCEVSYVVTPREDQRVYRVAEIQNPTNAPLLSGPVEVYVRGEYVLTVFLDKVAARQRFDLGLGVEQALRCARNASFEARRSRETVVATTELVHELSVELVNNLDRAVRCEVRERIPQPASDAEVVVEEGPVEPEWESYTQEERHAPILGGRRWRVEVPAKGQRALKARYVIQIYANSELDGGNRREE